MPRFPEPPDDTKPRPPSPAARLPEPAFDSRRRAALANQAGPLRRHGLDELVKRHAAWVRDGFPPELSYDNFLARLQLLLVDRVVQRAGAKLAVPNRRWLLSEQELVEEVANRLLADLTEGRTVWGVE